MTVPLYIQKPAKWKKIQTITGPLHSLKFGEHWPTGAEIKLLIFIHHMQFLRGMQGSHCLFTGLLAGWLEKVILYILALSDNCKGM